MGTRSRHTGRGEEIGLDIDTVEDLYSADYLRDCANDQARQERLAELKRRIELGAYRIDSGSIAEHMVDRITQDDEKRGS
jgi:anti-sigma28 factor (negative regulator of flagellin synthesis)